MASGWKRLVGRSKLFCGPGKCPIAAYSEFMPPPRVGPLPYDDAADWSPFSPDDPFGWQVNEYEEAFQLRPGLEMIGRRLVETVEHLGRGRPAHGIPRTQLDSNPYWPRELAERAGRLTHERYVVLLPLALSRTKDDKGRDRWTLFGASEQGPGRAFWKGFWLGPRTELPQADALGFLRRLLQTAYGEPAARLADLRQAGLRILDGGAEEKLPSWTGPLLLGPREAAAGVRWLLTFRPFGRLPARIRQAYLAGDLHLLPFPGSLVFWGAPSFVHLSRQLPLAMQIPLLMACERHEGPREIRIPQAGYVHVPSAEHPEPDPDHGVQRTEFVRTHRWGRVHRYENELAGSLPTSKLVHVLFSSEPDDVALYHKPMARNAQIWNYPGGLVLDGPAAGREEIRRAKETFRAGGHFGYRFQFPAVRVGRHEVYWHRTLAACVSPKTRRPEVIQPAPLGYLTAYRAARLDLARPVELWPRVLERTLHAAAVREFHVPDEHPPHRIAVNIRKLLYAFEQSGHRPIPAAMARRLLVAPKEETLDEWLAWLATVPADKTIGQEMVAELRQRILEEKPAPPRRAKAARPWLTFDHTARRRFEVAYWQTIARLAAGEFRTKDNGDCPRDGVSEHVVPHHHRDLEPLGDALLEYYRRLIARQAPRSQAAAGELPFGWHTDFDFPWLGGWLGNQQGKLRERDLMVVIPGRDRGRAVVMADHYDTAYMEDRYEPERGGNHARLAAAGADDNHSATAALMLGAEVFLEMSRAGRLGCDVWLVHLTGEEFPSDCLGARHLAESLVERTLRLQRPEHAPIDLSAVQVRGVYVLDMIAHNTHRGPDVFQIAPGTGPQSLWLARQAHEAAEAWNAGAALWNRRPSRRGRGAGSRSPHPHVVPPVAAHPHLIGQIRPTFDPHSTLYNTDGQIFSDAGIPVVLFMENYDINREGYHDTKDTMANIDLDYGSAVAAIAIESVARAACNRPPE